MDKFVGIPYIPHGRDYNGADCWGIVFLFYRDVLKTPIPSYSTEMQTRDFRPRTIDKLILAERELHWEKASLPRTGDVVLMRTGKNEHHVGIYIEDKQILHSEDVGSYSHIIKTNDIRYKNRIVGYFRLKDAC